MEHFDWNAFERKHVNDFLMNFYTYNNKVYINSEEVYLPSENVVLDCIIYKKETYINAKHLLHFIENVCYTGDKMVVYLNSSSISSKDFSFIKRTFIGDNHYTIRASWDENSDIQLMIVIDRTPIELK
jgi:hypothetical protein